MKVGKITNVEKTEAMCRICFYHCHEYENRVGAVSQAETIPVNWA